MPAIFINPSNEVHTTLLKDLNIQNKDLRVFISDEQPREYIDSLPGKKAIGDIKDDTHISTASHGAYCSIYFEDEIENLRETFITSIKNSSTSRIIWISSLDPNDLILNLKNLVYVLIDSKIDYIKTVLELENAEAIDRNLIDLKNV
ncbi:MAG: hypothetical protein O3C71_04595 [Actinomycetota bacterium]|nr:hypothetical protein [Actinomycetota bacterium]